ncbi:MAG: hypothetical protein GC164_03625 [Phycisphaera sp.]|nr:hypothetical protein [Phycisphaera sp.]
MDAKKSSRYAVMVTEHAERALERVPGWGTVYDSNLAFVLPAGALLLRDDVSHHAALGAVFKRLITEGNPAPGNPFNKHARAIYHPLVVHVALRAFALRYETLPVSVWGVCEDALPALVEPMRGIEEFTDAPPHPEVTDLVLWEALCLYEQARLAARDIDSEWITAVVHQAISQPGPGGSLHAMQNTDSSDVSLDAWTYRELCALQALWRLATLTGEGTWLKRAREAAHYHVQNTQPDHTTTQPWALAAFLFDDSTAPFGEQQLHDATTQAGMSDDIGVTALLLCDAAETLHGD